MKSLKQQAKEYADSLNPETTSEGRGYLMHFGDMKANNICADCSMKTPDGIPHDCEVKGGGE